MAFIRYNQKNILIDCGSTTSNLASNVLKNFCTEKGITDIDLCVITHFHDDHVNLLFTKDLNITINKILYCEPKADNDNFYKIKEYTIKNNISFLEVNRFDVYEWNNMKLYILSPDINKKIEAEDIDNANSIVLLASFKNSNFLFMGDSTKETEKSLIKKIKQMENVGLKNEITNNLNNLKAIQIGHHGSITSTSEEFLNILGVENAVISAKKKKFGHPSDEVVERLKKNGINVLITESIGAIKFKI